MLLVFWIVPVISRIDSIGGGRAGGGWGGGGGGWEAEGGLKQPLRLKEQCCAFSLWHKLIQSTKEAKTGVSIGVAKGGQGRAFAQPSLIFAQPSKFFVKVSNY